MHRHCEKIWRSPLWHSRLLKVLVYIVIPTIISSFKICISVVHIISIRRNWKQKNYTQLNTRDNCAKRRNAWRAVNKWCRNYNLYVVLLHVSCASLPAGRNSNLCVINISTTSTALVSRNLHCTALIELVAGKCRKLRRFILFSNFFPVSSRHLQRARTVLITYVLSLNFQTCRFAHWRESHVALGVFTIVFAIFPFAVAVSTQLSVVYRHFCCPISLFQGHVACRTT